MIRTVTLNGFLSFRSEPSVIELGPLNVLIGPNGAGKSNLIEALALLRTAPLDPGLSREIAAGGGIQEWLWKGDDGAERATMEFVLEHPELGMKTPLRHRLVLGREGESFALVDERIEDEQASPGEEKPYFYFGYESGRPMINARSLLFDGPDNLAERYLTKTELDRSKSVLAQRSDPDTYPEITRLGGLLKRVRVYRNWSFGPVAKVRESCLASEPTGYLSEDFDNLPVRLAQLKRDRRTRERLKEIVGELSPNFAEVIVATEGGRIQLEMSERDRTTPARRLSDGTLRFLCIAAILLDPAPPPLLVIEEPELGLHPDALLVVRDLLVDASTRTQVVLTTHSTVLVDAFTEHPEAIVVCDKRDDGTEVRRLSPDEIAAWGSDRGLASLWLSGHLGGTR